MKCTGDADEVHGRCREVAEVKNMFRGCAVEVQRE